VLPAGIQFISRIVPHTYALEGLRLIMMTGCGMENSVVRNNLFVMLGFAVFAMLLGVFALEKALEGAHSANGVGMVV